MPDRKLKIINYSWHIAHQYELYKIPNTEWYHVVNPYRRWDTGRQFRPRPDNLFDVPFYEPGKYDLAVLHVDQQCVDASIGKSKLYKQMNEVVKDIPKIVINHGTPFWPEVATEDYLRLQTKMMIGDNYMVVNSHRAKEMWGPMGREVTTIIHGLDADEWLDLPKEPIVVTSLSAAGLDQYYNRSLLLAVKEKLAERGVKHIWVGEEWISQDFEDLKKMFGKALIYFNPTLESPMPRSRTEAMLSGACVITLPNHGAEDFIQHGVNGFHVPNNPTIVADLITQLMYSGLYKKVIEIGQRGKETAQKEFSHLRFQKDWSNLFEKVLRENGKL